MCGLIGTYGVELTEDDIRLIDHRGPDSWGMWTNGTTYLGHTRLAIRDLRASANQPYQVRNIVVTYNGELWNDQQLRAAFGCRWLTTSDTETVATAIAAFGIESLGDLDGMWALAWHDMDQGRTYLARDHYGRVPLYYTVQDSLFGQTVRWASERKALPYGIPAMSIPPGHVYCVQTGELTDYRHTTLGTPSADPGMVLDLLRTGVRERLVSDAPVCYLASGGLDSSLILALARELQPYAEMVAYTAVYDTASKDLEHARAICRLLDVNLVEVKVPEPTEQAAREAVHAIEVPFKAQVEIAMAHLPLSKAIQSDGFKVCLSGEAADELFGGYGNTQIAASHADDNEYREIKRALVSKMARGNFIRVNKVMMAYGIEARLPFMQRSLVDLAVNATKEQSPPGKKLLKQAANGIVPDSIIRRPKDTFQGGTGIATAAAALSSTPTRTYNAMARALFGYLPPD
jgi:asparagine synthase (glutamine-hydrolysing)